MFAQGFFRLSLWPRCWFEKCTSEVGANDCYSGRSSSRGKRGECSNSSGNKGLSSELEDKSGGGSESELTVGLSTTEFSVPSSIVPIFLQSRAEEWQYCAHFSLFFWQLHWDLGLHVFSQIQEIASLLLVSTFTATAFKVMTLLGAFSNSERRAVWSIYGTTFNSQVG